MKTLNKKLVSITLASVFIGVSALAAVNKNDPAIQQDELARANEGSASLNIKGSADGLRAGTCESCERARQKLAMVENPNQRANETAIDK